MKAIDLSAPRSKLRVRIDPSPAYDFLACLFLLARPWRGGPPLEFDISTRWVARARATLGGDLRAALALFFPPRSRTAGLVGVMANASGLSVPEFIRRVAAAPPADLLELMLTESLADRETLPKLRRAIGGPASAIEEFLQATDPVLDRRRLRRLVSLSPAEAKARLLHVLREGYARVYAPMEEEVIPLLARDAASLERRAVTATGSELIEYATGGFVVGPEAGVSAVVLAPTYFFRPYNLITAYHGVRVYIYPIRHAHADHIPPSDLVRLYKALGDETRLKLLRLIAGREMYLQELATALGVSHVTVLHHLALLRAAGLVQVVERGTLKYYRLRPARAHEAADEWLKFVGIEGGKEVRGS